MKNQRQEDEREAIKCLIRQSNKRTKSKKKTNNTKNKKVEITNPPNEIKQFELHNDELTTFNTTAAMKSSDSVTTATMKAMNTTKKVKATHTTKNINIIEHQKNIIPLQNHSQTHPHNLRPRRKRQITESQEIFNKNGNNQFANVKSFKDLQRPSKRSKKSKSQETTTVKIESRTPINEHSNLSTNTDNGKKLLSKVEILEKELLETKNLYDEINRQLKTHTEAIQGLMQVVSTPQNLTNFQHQYAYQQLPNTAAQHNQPVQYVPIYGYPQMYYSPMQMNQQQTAAAVVMNQAATVVAPQQMQQIIANNNPTSPIDIKSPIEENGNLGPPKVISPITYNNAMVSVVQHPHQNGIPVHQNRIPVHQNRIPVHQNRIPVQQNRIPVLQQDSSSGSPSSAYEVQISRAQTQQLHQPQVVSVVMRPPPPEVKTEE